MRYPFYGSPRITEALRKSGVYPYLLCGVKIQRVNQVWSTDLTYIPMRSGWMYLMAVMMKFTTLLESEDVDISMDGRGRAIDNVFIERLWRSLKYEDIYIKDYQTVQELREGLQQYFLFYNTVRQHQALEYRTPLEVYRGA